MRIIATAFLSCSQVERQKMMLVEVLAKKGSAMADMYVSIHNCDREIHATNATAASINSVSSTSNNVSSSNSNLVIPLPSIATVANSTKSNNSSAANCITTNHVGKLNTLPTLPVNHEEIDQV